MSDEYLEHHGILGQKWGVRRTPAQLGHAPSPKKKPVKAVLKDGVVHLGQSVKKTGSTVKSKISNANKNRQIRKGNYKSLSNDDLKKLVDRMNMERQLSQINKELNPKRKSVVADMVGKAARNLGDRALNVAVDKIIGKLTEKKDKSLEDFKGKDLSKLGSGDLKTLAGLTRDRAAITANVGKYTKQVEAGIKENTSESTKTSTGKGSGYKLKSFKGGAFKQVSNIASSAGIGKKKTSTLSPGSNDVVSSAIKTLLSQELTDWD